MKKLMRCSLWVGIVLAGLLLVSGNARTTDKPGKLEIGLCAP
ncbi:MAG: hypothetical protein ABSH25_08115 [Syntrophorhabdales bacterium]|jgi:hypothetical protein